MKTLQTIILLLAANIVMAQIPFNDTRTYYYNDTKTFYESGYTYQCDVDKTIGGMVTLYNKDNIYTYEPLVFEDTGLDAGGSIFINGMKPLEDDNWTRQACRDIADRFFSFDERTRVQRQEYGITMIIDSSTGKVIEVEFRFMYNRPFATIPVSTYRQIELELKNNIWFTPTDDGKRMRFIMRGWRHEVKPHVEK